MGQKPKETAKKPKKTKKHKAKKPKNPGLFGLFKKTMCLDQPCRGVNTEDNPKNRLSRDHTFKGGVPREDPPKDDKKVLKNSIF